MLRNSKMVPFKLSGSIIEEVEFKKDPIEKTSIPAFPSWRSKAKNSKDKSLSCSR